MQQLDPSCDSLANRLAALALALSDRQMADDGDGLSPTARAILNTLAAYPGTGQAEMARIAGKSPSLMVRAVDALAAQGLVARREGADRRSAALHLTPAGQHRQAGLAADRAQVLRSALAAVDPALLPALASAIDAMLAALTDGRQAADHLCRLCDEAACGPDCPVECKVAGAARLADVGR